MGILSSLLPNETLARVLRGAEESCPYPTADDRKAWSGLPAELVADLVTSAEKLAVVPVAALPATLYLDYTRTGNRERFQKPYFERRRALTALALAECVEDGGRFLDPLADTLWAVCEESSWVIPAHNRSGQALDDPEHPTIDLFAAETGATLAWAHRLLGRRLDAVSPRLARRIVVEVRRRILEPYMAHDEGWMGIGSASPPNNWNPWCNSNCLAAFLLLERDPALRVAAVARVVQTLDIFLDGYGPDGGCDEGPSYWGRAAGSLLDCLELLRHATGNAVDFYALPLVREMGSYLRRMHIADTWFVNFADAPARMLPSAATVWLYGERTGDDRLRALGAWAQRHRDTSVAKLHIPSVQRALDMLFLHDRIADEKAHPAEERDAWMSHIEVLTAREGATGGEGFFLAARGGHNAESHNHNDVGSFVVFHDGRPLIVDVGVETYTAKTFSAHRYEIWTMRSLYHNLPEVNAAEQGAGAQFRAANALARLEPAEASLALDIAGAYPPQADICHWRRTCRLLRGAAVAAGETLHAAKESRERQEHVAQPPSAVNPPTANMPHSSILTAEGGCATCCESTLGQAIGGAVEVTDDFALGHASNAVGLHLMTAVAPDLSEPGVLRFAGADAGRPVRLTYPAAALAATVEPIELTDPQLRAVWGERVYRVRLDAKDAVASAIWTLRLEREG